MPDSSACFKIIVLYYCFCIIFLPGATTFNSALSCLRDVIFLEPAEVPLYSRALVLSCIHRWLFDSRDPDEFSGVFAWFVIRWLWPAKWRHHCTFPWQKDWPDWLEALIVAIRLLNYFRFYYSVLEIALVVGSAWARLWSGPGVLLALEAVIAFLSPGCNHKSWVHCPAASGADPQCHFLFLISHQCAVMNCTLQVNCTLSKKSRNSLWSLAGRWVSIWASEHFPVQENAAYWFLF